jgi:hypothetical protein
MEVQYQGSMFMQSRTTSTKDGHLRVHLAYGPVVTGVKVAEAWTDDGKIIHEIVDGRALMPMPLGADSSAARFVDGRPSPATTIAPGVLDAVGELMAEASSLAHTCDAPPISGEPASGGVQPAAGRGDPAAGGLQPLSGSYDGNSGQLDDPQDSSKCILCKGACVAVGTGCAFLVLKGCAATAAGGIFGGVALAVCLIVGAVVCSVTEVGCEAACSGGGSCCPSHCGNRCCDQNDTCLNNASELCCPQGSFGCPINQVGGGSVCCNDGDQCMAANSTQCCPAADQLCPPEHPKDCCDASIGSQCLYDAPNATSQSCTVCANTICAGVCCNADEACGGTECCPTESACPDTCCGEATPICVGPTNARPPKGTCCSPSQACNGNTTCCGDGTQCVKPVNSTPAQQFCCDDLSACGTFCCDNPSTPLCGRDGETEMLRCCPGSGATSLCGPSKECCDSGQTCMNFPTPDNPQNNHCCSPTEVCGEGNDAVCCKVATGNCEAGKCVRLISGNPSNGSGAPSGMGK